jgi:hypothetical protein
LFADFGGFEVESMIEGVCEPAAQGGREVFAGGGCEFALTVECPPEFACVHGFEAAGYQFGFEFWEGEVVE